jgi:hypothetical protein
MNIWTYLCILTLGLGLTACNEKSDNPEGTKNPQKVSPQEKMEENSNNLSIEPDYSEPLDMESEATQDESIPNKDAGSTACDCFEIANVALDDLLSKHSPKEIANNPKIMKDFEKKLDQTKGAENCDKLMKEINRKYKNPQDFLKICPAAQKLMTKIMKIGS